MKSNRILCTQQNIGPCETFWYLTNAEGKNMTLAKNLLTPGFDQPVSFKFIFTNIFHTFKITN